MSSYKVSTSICSQSFFQGCKHIRIFKREGKRDRESDDLAHIKYLILLGLFYNYNNYYGCTYLYFIYLYCHETF